MTDYSIFSSLFDNMENSVETDEKKIYYRAVKTNAGDFGVSSDNKLITGITLEEIPLKEDEEGGFCPLEDALDNDGSDAPIILPEEGLILGHIYLPVVINISTDWETGFTDSWDVKLEDVTDTYEDQ